MAKKKSRQNIRVDGLRKNALIKKEPTKNKKFLVYGGMLSAVVAVTVMVILSGRIDVKSATFGWLSTDWSGGASTTAVASHTNDQTGWTKFYSKDDNVDVTSVSGQASIAVTASTSVTTSDADFNAFTHDNTYVSGGAVYIKRPDGGSCSSGTECVNGWCNANVCTNPWITGTCAGIGVYYQDVSGTKQWKNANTNCDTPQCGQDGGQDGDNLVASNSVDFSAYPARDACKALGGRLPTMTELSCMYTNRASYNTYGAFQSASYWSSTENDATNAWRISFSNGGSSFYTKTFSYYVRCVRGQ